MNLALVVPGPLDRRSGGYSYDVDLVDHLKSLAFRVEVWSLPVSAGKARRELGRRLGAEGPQVIVFDALVHASVVGVLEALRPRSQALWIGLVHHLAWLEDPEPGTGTPRKRARERRFLETMDAFLFNSEDTRRTVSALRGPGAGFRPSLVCRPPLGPVPETKSVPTGAGRLLFLGNLVPRKNLHGLLEALTLLHRRRPELPWELTVAGSPGLAAGYVRRCRQIVHRAGLENKITWEGRISNQRREELWSCTDLLVLPSLHEGWGMAHAEALARGIVSLAVPRGGALEVLGDSALWAEADAPALSAALERFLGDSKVRLDLARKARHRGAFLYGGGTGFLEVETFLANLKDGKTKEAPVREDFNFGAYLEAKASVDSRSLNPRVLEAAFAGRLPGRILELGGGTGTMARRLRATDRIGPETSYELVDRGEVGLQTAREKTSGLFNPGRFTTREADLLEVWDHPLDAPPDLVVAHALLDLFDPRAAAPALARLGARRYWLTHLFDGLTAWEPRIDSELDEAVVKAYHRSMDERAPGGAQGGSRSGRDWLTALPRAGFRIIEAGASDWIVRPTDGIYPDDESRFLKSILHFFRTSLTGRNDLDQAGLNWWLAVRSTQIDRGQTVFLAHQLDIAAELANDRPGMPS